ncbi:hypothetical protein AALA22_15115 [Anaerovoracaceae bacterium 41-7]
MTNKEAIKILEKNKPTSDPRLCGKELCQACDTAIRALKKQIPTIPDYEGDGYSPDGTFVYDTWICPKCETHYEVDYDDYKYCPNCGQAIDWSDGRWEDNI